jgi:DNA-binding HxlR family transcriptional regulator
MQKNEFSPIFEQITQTRKVVRLFLNSHTKNVPHDQDRIRMELPLLETTTDVVSKKWAVQILWVLEIQKDMIFNEMSRFLTGISTRSLSETLKVLEKHELITRIIEETRPPKVHYSLSEKGRGFIELAMPLVFYLNEKEI